MVSHAAQCRLRVRYLGHERPGFSAPRFEPENPTPTVSEPSCSRWSWRMTRAAVGSKCEHARVRASVSARPRSRVNSQGARSTTANKLSGGHRIAMRHRSLSRLLSGQRRSDAASIMARWRRITVSANSSRARRKLMASIWRSNRLFKCCPTGSGAMLKLAAIANAAPRIWPSRQRCSNISVIANATVRASVFNAMLVCVSRSFVLACAPALTVTSFRQLPRRLRRRIACATARNDGEGGARTA